MTESEDPVQAVERPGRGIAEAQSGEDEILVKRCREGDQAAWGELVRRHSRRVYGLAYRFVGRADEAEDIAQEVFVKVYLGMDRYRGSEGTFASWLSAVARNHAIDHCRRRRPETSLPDDGAGLDAMPGHLESPHQTLERHERQRLVRRGLRALPPELRIPVVLCDIEGRSYDEIAEALGLPLGTVKSRINRGRLELVRRLLGRYGEEVRRA